MVEILWKSKAPHSRIQDHEVVELRLVEFGSSERRYLVREIHASWSASGQQIYWQGYNDNTYGTPQEARRSFESLRASIVDAGFRYATVLE
jgi:hypothetical protein